MTERIVFFNQEAQREKWNCFVSSSSQGHFMQTWEWGSFKASLGWQVERIGLERGGQLVAAAQILFRPLPLLPMAIAYIPKGPIVDLRDEEIATCLFATIHEVARQRRTVFLKIEPNVLDTEEGHQRLQRYGFQPTAQTNQPRSTLVIDLTVGEESLFSRMRHKTRQLIRRAEREGVEIVQGDIADLDSFYRVLNEASEIKQISVHKKEFYERAWQTFRQVEAVKLLLARYQGKVVAGKMIFVFKQRSMHFWGGTSPRGREIHASYLIQWESIKWAIRHGCYACDLWGIPDEIAEIMRCGKEIPQNEQKGLWGVYTFKRGFGGEIESYVGAYDYPYSSLPYQIGTKVLSARNHAEMASHWLEFLRRR